MKRVLKWVVRILGVLVGLLAFPVGMFVLDSPWGYGNQGAGIAIMVVGAVLFLAGWLGLRRLKAIKAAVLAVSRKALKYLWATKLRRSGVTFALVTLVAVVVLVVWQAMHPVTP